MCVVAGTWPSSDETGTSIDPEPASIDPMPTLGINIIPIDPPAALPFQNRLLHTGNAARLVSLL